MMRRRSSAASGQSRPRRANASRVVSIVRHLAIAAAVLVAIAGRMNAQSATAPVLKAAFIYNIAKFAEWPADVVPAQGPITLCVNRDDAVAQPLVDAANGQKIGDHPLLVVKTAADAQLRSCQLAYLPGLDAQRTSKVLESLEGAAVLTVGDSDKFTALGGVAQLFVEGDRLRFAINVDAAQRSHLRLSSKLLALAKIVHDDRGGSQP